MAILVKMLRSGVVRLHLKECTENVPDFISSLQLPWVTRGRCRDSLRGLTSVALAGEKHALSSAMSAGAYFVAQQQGLLPVGYLKQSEGPRTCIIWLN